MKPGETRLPAHERRPVFDRLPRLGPEPDLAERQKLLRVRGRSIAGLPPLLLLVAIPVVDWNTSGDFRILSWLVLVPAVAAAVCRVWTTTLFAVLAQLTYALGDNAWPHEYQTGLPDFILIAAGGALSVLACAVRVRGEQRMLHMRDVAETTRRTVLRPLPPGWGGLDHAAVYLAADSEARVGGDFYDIQTGPHGTRVLLGDVQGKGLGAVETAAALLGTFREAAHHEARLTGVAGRLEKRMLRHVRYRAALGHYDAERFATAVLLDFPPAAVNAGSAGDAGSRLSGDADGHPTPDDPHPSIEIVGFGHEPPLVVAADGVRWLPLGDGLPLGLSELGDGPPHPYRAALAPGETLLLFTDGVTEARDGRGVFFPLYEYVAAAVAADPATAQPGNLVGLVRDGVLGHCGGRLADDTTIFAVRPRPTTGVPGVGEPGAAGLTSP
ncbi:PP2C family protein-serine/threonine phosphatase [Streptomyces sp. NPDC002845]